MDVKRIVETDYWDRVLGNGDSRNRWAVPLYRRPARLKEILGYFADAAGLVLLFSFCLMGLLAAWAFVQ